MQIAKVVLENCLITLYKIKMITIRGHHLHSPLPIDLKSLSDDVMIVDTYDNFCKETCVDDFGHLGCVESQREREVDIELAKHYGFEIGRTYTPGEFVAKIGQITPEQAMEGSRITARYFGVV